MYCTSLLSPGIKIAGLPKLFTDFIGLLKLVKLYSKQDGNP
jgi:hypothetical protein